MSTAKGSAQCTGFYTSVEWDAIKVVKPDNSACKKDERKSHETFSSQNLPEIPNQS